MLIIVKEGFGKEEEQKDTPPINSPTQLLSKVAKKQKDARLFVILLNQGLFKVYKLHYSLSPILIIA